MSLSTLDSSKSMPIVFPVGTSWYPLPEAGEAAPERPAPARRPAPGWFEALMWAVLFFVVTQLPAVGLLVWSEASGAGLKLFSDYGLHSLFVGQILGVGMSLLALRGRVGKNWASAIHLRLPRLVPCLLAVLTLPAVSLLAVGTMGTTVYLLDLEMPKSTLLDEAQPALWFSLLVIAVGAPVNEELFCRGFLGRGLVRRYGILIGVLFTSFIFAALHANIYQGIVALILGSYCHLTYLATRSLWVPVLMHLLHNATVTVLAFSLSGGSGNAAPAEMPNYEPNWQMAVAVTLASYAAVMLFIGVPVLSAFGLYRLRERQPSEEQHVT